MVTEINFSALYRTKMKEKEVIFQFFKESIEMQLLKNLECKLKMKWMKGNMVSLAYIWHSKLRTWLEGNLSSKNDLGSTNSTMQKWINNEAHSIVDLIRQNQQPETVVS